MMVACLDGKDALGLLSASGSKLKVTKGLGSLIKKWINLINSIAKGNEISIRIKAFLSLILPLNAIKKIAKKDK